MDRRAKEHLMILLTVILIALVFIITATFQIHKQNSYIIELETRIAYDDSVIVELSSQLDRVDSLSRSITVHDLLFR